MVGMLTALVMLLVATGNAQQGPCGDADGLEARAYQNQLTDEERACIQDAIDRGIDPVVRAEYSFALIIDAYAHAELTRYGDLMRKHLTDYHTTDAEVAFLFANHLWSQYGASDDVIRWAKVAMEGRRRWLNNRANYDKMVKSLWDILVEVSMVRAVEVGEEYNNNPTDGNKSRLEKYRHQARYYLVIAAPCLHYGDCGPYYDVEVEGWAPCDDLDTLEATARRGLVGSDQQACLRSKYRKPQSPKPRILALLADQADAETLATRDSDRNPWEELLAWHYNVTGLEDPFLAARYAEFLVEHDKENTREALRWAEAALEQKEELKGRSGRAAMRRLYQLRIETMEQVVAKARSQSADDPTPVNKTELTKAKAQLEAAEQAYKDFCAEAPQNCR